MLVAVDTCPTPVDVSSLCRIVIIFVSIIRDALHLCLGNPGIFGIRSQILQDTGTEHFTT
jgi:hypothetical protein